jgi:hypothetical protein
MSSMRVIGLVLWGSSFPVKAGRSTGLVPKRRSVGSAAIAAIG